jgi:hypothetical protein
MGRKYEQLSLDDRCEIARLQAEGQTIRQRAWFVPKHEHAGFPLSREINGDWFDAAQT